MAVELTPTQQERFDELITPFESIENYYNVITKPVDEVVFDLIITLYINSVLDLKETRSILEQRS